MLLPGWNIDEHNRIIERHLLEIREAAECNRLARSGRTPRKLRRAMGGALIAAGRALAA